VSLGDELVGLLGPDSVSVEPDELRGHATDHLPTALLARRTSSIPPLPAAVVRPAGVEQVSAVLRWAHERRTPIVPFGAGSGVCGGVAMPADAVVVDLRAMNRIIDIDDKSMLVRAEAGVMGPDLSSELESAGHFLGHEPQSIGISTVGGWVATRACGQLSARYGGIEDLIAGLEAVLPDGRVARSRTTPRSSTGPDVARLMIGSEGTLGIVTEATLRIHPMPEGRVDRAVRFEHMADGVAACRGLARSELSPTLVRLYDREDSFVAFSNLEDPPTGPLLMLSFDGRDAQNRADEAVAGLQADELDPGIVEFWWAHRNDAVGSFITIMSGEGVLGPHAMIDTMEVAGTWTVLRALYHDLKEALSVEADFVGCHLSHVYPDGACLYFTMGSACPDDEVALTTHARWWETGMKVCIASGGSISHHHGIGRLKAPWIRSELGEWFEVLLAVKAAIDPHSIMNPGALGL
jgi:alkyldihydroxyacetonephosphate synthase